MSSSVVFSSTLKQRLQLQQCNPGENKDGSDAFGCLYGFCHEGKITVTAAVRLKESCLTDFKDRENQIIDSASILQTGLSVVGVFKIFVSKKDENDSNSWLRFPEINDFFSSINELMQDDQRISSYVVVTSRANNFDLKILEHNENKLEEPSDVKFVTWNSLYTENVILRVTGSFPITFSFDKDASMDFSDSLNKLCSTVESEHLWYQLKNSSLIFNGFIEKLSELSCNNLYDHLDIDMDNRNRKKKTQMKPLLELAVLKKESNITILDKSLVSSPVIHYKKVKCNSYSFPVEIDAVVITHSSNTVFHLMKLVNRAVLNQLHSVRRCFPVCTVKEEKFCHPRPFMFRPIFCDHYVTLFNPDGFTDQELESSRKKIHEKLLLPMDRPLFRFSNIYTFYRERGYPYLLNPHEALPPSEVENGEVSAVIGTYSYHHYMQDGKDDKGWGCAYRSLQTVISWFKFQGYTDIDIPNHDAIQKALVEVGDKPASFVGTKKWIGSTEVNYCLDHFLNVTSKIMFVNTGSELANKGRELSNHFKTQGTPIMIGGGVLAHTILGVDWSETSGDIRFLILDPHYTGGEDISIVTNKGWCGWKGPDFWDKSAYYNLCMPQRPIDI